MPDFEITTHLNRDREQVRLYVVAPVGRPDVVLVRYQNFAGGRPILWEQRIVANPPLPRWTKISGAELENRMRQSNIRQGGDVAPDDGIALIDRLGYFDAPTLSAGNIYRVWATTDPAADPNVAGTELPEMRCVMAAGQRGTVLGPGGVVPTQAIDNVRLEITRTPAPVCDITELGRGAPQEHPVHGYSFFDSPIARSTGCVPVNGRSFTFGELLPGVTYTVVVRVMATSGRWQEIVREFTPLQRRVDITVDSVRIINDGDPFADSEGYFKVQAFTGIWGDAAPAAVVRSFRFPGGAGLAEFEDGDLFGTGGSIHPTGPPYTFRIGPEPVDRNEFGVRLEVFDEDGVGEPDEFNSGVWEPPGFIEPITNGSFTFNTTIENGDVEAQAKGHYSIRHVTPGPPPGPWQSFDVPLADDLRVDRDYDGDQKTDSAVWRPDGSIWFIEPSSGGPVTAQRFGAAGDYPAPADYDGDGRTDLAVWRPGQAKWLVQPSSGGPVLEHPTGQDGTPVPAEDRDRLLALARALAATAQQFGAARRQGEAAGPARGAIEIFLREGPQASDGQAFDVVFQVGIFSGYMPAAEAVTTVQQAVAIAQKLAAAHPDNTDYQYRHAWILCVHAQRLEAAGRRPEAAEPSRTAIAIFLRLAPAAADAYKYDLIFQVGIFSGYLPPAEAVAPVQQAVIVAEQLVQAHSDNGDYRARLEWIREVLAQRQAAAGG